MKLVPYIAVGLLLTLKCVAGCFAGNKSIGVTLPVDDIFVKKDGELMINCTLNEMLNHTQNASDLYWMFRETKFASPEYVTVLNSHTAQLQLKNMQLKDAGYYSCCLNDHIYKDCLSICGNSVRVGVSVKKVTNFKCVMLELETITCTWDAQHCGIPTNWTVKYSNQMGFVECPEYKRDESNEVNGCFITRNRYPMVYPLQSKNITFKIKGKNDLGESDTSFLVEHFNRVVASSPVNVNVSDIGNNRMKITWNVNPTFKYFEDPLMYRVSYHSNWDPDEHWNNIDVIGTTNHTLTDLIPWSNYTIVVRCKVLAAPDTEDFWSQGVARNIKTLLSVPSAVVEMSPSGFDDINISIDQRDITVFWKPLKMPEYHGPNFHYIVRVYSENTELYNSVVYPQNFTATFGHLKKKKSYRFTVQAANDFGVSEKVSEINVFSTDSKLPDVRKLAVHYHNNGAYQVSWEPYNNSALEEFVVFWCKSLEIIADQCKEGINWTSVDPDMSQFNIKVAEPNSHYRFAVSAAGLNRSSGLDWSTCTAPIDKAIRKITLLPLAPINSTAVHVSWLFDCADRAAYIKGFIIIYCILNSENKECQSELNQTIYDTSVASYTLTNLQPFTNYSVSVAAILKEGKPSEIGDAEIILTPQDKPAGPPIKLELIDVTNSSITIQWVAPEKPNGVINKYKVYYNDDVERVNGSENLTYQLTLKKRIRGYTNYSIHLCACTVAGCSNTSNSISVTTRIGVPSQPDKPSTKQLDSKHVQISWNNPSHPNGLIDFWILLVKIYKAGENNESNALVDGYRRDVTNKTTTVEIINDGKIFYQFSVAAVNIIPAALTNDNSSEVLIGQFSEPAELRYLYQDDELAMFYGLTIGIPLGGVFFIFIIFISFRYLKNNCNTNLEIVLPDGFYIKEKIVDSHKKNESDLNRNFKRGQSESSSEGRTSQSSTETVIQSISSMPDDFNWDKLGFFTPKSMSDSGNETDSNHSHDSVFSDPSENDKSTQDFKNINNSNLEKFEVLTNYSQVKEVALNENVNYAVLSRPTLPGYSRMDIVQPAVNSYVTNHKMVTGALNVEEEIKESSPYVQTGYSKVANGMFRVTNPNGYITTDVLQQNNQCGQTTIKSSLYLPKDNSQSLNSNYVSNVNTSINC